jgi:hypothetical protein
MKIKQGGNMKKVMMGLVLLVSTLFTYAQQVLVRSDHELNTDFSKYKTFYWAPQVVDKTDSEAMFLNDLTFKALIMEAVADEMEGLGYTPDENAPDLIVNFRVFDKPARIKGTEGYGNSYWGGQEYRSISDTTSYKIDPGTLLVSLVDRKQSRMIWHGFASGLLNNNEFVRDEVKIREAVKLIFDEYGQRAPGLTRK